MTRAEAIDILKTLWQVSIKGGPIEEAMEIAIQALEETQWIPVNERLPETHETGNSFSGIYMQSSPVLVYGVPEYEEEYGFYVVTYCDDKNGCTYWSTELDAVTINEVYAWMPLPEAYKGSDEE